MKRVVLVVALLLAAGACSKVTYQNPAASRTGVVHRTKGHFLIAGLVGHKRIDVYQMCPGGVSRIQSKYTVVDVVLTLITFYVYSPRTYDIECGAGGAP